MLYLIPNKFIYFLNHLFLEGIHNLLMAFPVFYDLVPFNVSFDEAYEFWQ